MQSTQPSYRIKFDLSASFGVSPVSILSQPSARATTPVVLAKGKDLSRPVVFDAAAHGLPGKRPVAQASAALAAPHRPRKSSPLAHPDAVLTFRQPEVASESARLSLAVLKLEPQQRRTRAIEALREQAIERMWQVAEEFDIAPSPKSGPAQILPQVRSSSGPFGLRDGLLISLTQNNAECIDRLSDSCDERVLEQRLAPSGKFLPFQQLDRVLDQFTFNEERGRLALLDKHAENWHREFVPGLR